MALPKISILKIKKGFTLIEILVVIGLFSFLAGCGLVISMDSYKSYNFSSEQDLLVGILQKARSQSLNNINQSAHGVYLGNSSYILFQGNSYQNRDQSEDVNFPGNAALQLSGQNEVVFAPLSATTTMGNIVLRDTTRQAVISLNTEGQINLH